jgi:hypothetical protein
VRTDLRSPTRFCPLQVLGDLRAQLAARYIGERGLLDLVARYGTELLEASFVDLLSYTEQLARAAIEHLPDGRYELVDYLDDDGWQSARQFASGRVSPDQGPKSSTPKVSSGLEGLWHGAVGLASVSEPRRGGAGRIGGRLERDWRVGRRLTSDLVRLFPPRAGRLGHPGGMPYVIARGDLYRSHDDGERNLLFLPIERDGQVHVNVEDRRLERITRNAIHRR